jgi:hypothetical protein
MSTIRRRRRRARPLPPPPPPPPPSAGWPPIRSFADSLAALLGLEERLGHVHAVMLLDGGGRIVDGLAVIPPLAIDELVVAGAGLAADHARARRALLLSGGQSPVDQIVEDELDRWRRYRRRFSDVGVELVDWLASDGENIRSYAITDIGDVAWSSPG